MRHHTKYFGDLGVLKAQLDLYRKGFFVSVPLTEHAPFDLVITKQSRSRTVQVKARRISPSGTLEIQFRSSWNDASGTHYRPVDKSLVDLYCVYNPDEDCCYYLNPSDFARSVTLRVRTPKNGQSEGINFASDYREVP